MGLLIVRELEDARDEVLEALDLTQLEMEKLKGSMSFKAATDPRQKCSEVVLFALHVRSEAIVHAHYNVSGMKSIVLCKHVLLPE